MKKLLLLFSIIFITSVNASKVYLFKNSINENKLLTNNDNYNYGDYILDQNQILIVPPENGIISNDIINTLDYNIKILENSKNSDLNDLEYNSTTGSFTYSPSINVVGEVSFRYYIEYENNKSNISYIYFYVRNNSTNYDINFYDNDTKEKIIPTVTRNSNVNLEITEKPIKIDNYKTISKPITKRISNSKDKNNFNFYYEKIPYTRI